MLLETAVTFFFVTKFLLPLYYSSALIHLFCTTQITLLCDIHWISLLCIFLQRLIIVTTSSEFMFHFTSNIFASPLWFVALFRVSLSCLHIITEFFNVYNIYFVFQTFHLSVIYNSSSDPIFYFIFIPFLLFLFLFLYRRVILLFCFTCSGHSITENVS